MPGGENAITFEDPSAVTITRRLEGSTLGFFFRRCSNETSPVDCKSQDEIDSWTYNHTIILGTLRNYIDFENVEPGVGPVKNVFEELLGATNIDWNASRTVYFYFDE